MNRLQYLDFDKFLTGINLPPPPSPQNFFITFHNSNSLFISSQNAVTSAREIYRLLPAIKL